MPAGRPLEPAGNGRPRWMTAGRDAARRPVHRIRLTGQLVRLTPHRLRQREDAAGFTRRKALAISPGFSMLLDVRRPGDGPGVDLVRWGSCGIPSIWHSPTTRHPGGNPRWNRCVRRLALPLGCRVVALREIDGMPHPAHPTPAEQFLRLVSRRSARPARARSFRLTRSLGDPAKLRSRRRERC
jgi:hypothetical protein